ATDAIYVGRGTGVTGSGNQWNTGVAINTNAQFGLYMPNSRFQYGSINIPKMLTGGIIAGTSNIPVIALNSSDNVSLRSDRMVITSAGDVGIGSTAPGARLHITSNDTSTNVKEVIRILRNDSDSPGANGLGAAINFVLEDDGSNNQQFARFDAVVTDATNGSE